MTPGGAVHDVEPVVVIDSTMYFVPVVVPAIEELLPVNDVRPTVTPKRSTVIDSAVDDPLVVPLNVWVAVIDHVPSAKVSRVHDPEESAQVTLLEPALVAVTVPVAPAESPETEIVGVESEVMLSVDEAPESLEASKSGVFGAITCE
ncbi:MAG: hypothetical protein FJW93_04550 [Actinobacteria bacterium]|nr:hypothetical protein [Actinomycetota bacterium]MBM3815874.1 hypothetical protein [Actinomycetota bacterium]